MVNSKINNLNDNSSSEFENLLSKLEAEPPPQETSTVKLLAAEWTNQAKLLSLEQERSIKPKVKLKTKRPADVFNRQWYKLPNGKWRPITPTKVSSAHKDNFIKEDGKWKAQTPKLNHPFDIDKSISNVQPSITKMQLAAKESISIQNDSGANICATGDKTSLINFKEIEPRSITSVNKDEGTKAVITGVGYLPMKSIENNILYIKTYFSPNMNDTIISPQAIAEQYHQDFNGWYQCANTDTQDGKLGLTSRSGDNIEFQLNCINNLWYHNNPKDPTVEKGSIVNSLTDAQSYQLWHARLGHPGKNVMQTIHKHVHGVNKLNGNVFWKCPSCMPMKLAIKQPLNTKSKRKPLQPKDIIDNTDKMEELNDEIYKKDALPGQHFHMDFGFVRSKEYTQTYSEGKIMTSIDGYKSYLLIIDRKSRYAWIFLTSSKHPPIKEAEAVLKKVWIQP